MTRKLGRSRELAPAGPFGSQRPQPFAARWRSAGDAIVAELNDSKLGTIRGPQVPREQFPSVGEGLSVWVQVPLCRRQGAVAGDLSEAV